MRIGILSDTHGDLTLARLALTNMGEIELLLHAGDHYNDAGQLVENSNVKLYAVVGNCDWHQTGPTDLLIDAGGKKIWLTHGHKYRIKDSMQALIEKAKEQKADIVVFGHTHIPTVETVDGILLFNPGSISFPRSRQGATYGVIEISNQEIIPQIFPL